jgi:dienelactone hydrolase
VLAAADALAKLPYVDPTKLFISGHSAGGTLTLLAAMTSDRFRAAASLSASPDMVENVAGQPDLAPFDRSAIREFQMRSPVAFATSFKCPVRIYYGSYEGWARDPSLRTAMLAKTAEIDAEAKVMSGDHFSSVPAGIGDAIRFFEGR